MPPKSDSWLKVVKLSEQNENLLALTVLPATESTVPDPSEPVAYPGFEEEGCARRKICSHAPQTLTTPPNQCVLEGS